MAIQKIAENINTAKTLVALRRDLPDHFRLLDGGRIAFLQGFGGLKGVAAWLADQRGANDATGAPTNAALTADHWRAFVHQLAGEADAGRMGRFLFFFLVEGHVLVPKHEVVMGVDTAHVAIGHEAAHVGNGGVELIWVVLDGNNVQASIERTANIPTSAESADDNPLPRPGVLRQKCLRQPIGLLMDVDRTTSTSDMLGQHPLARAHDMVVALDRVLAEVELRTEITDSAFEGNQADLDGRSALVDGANDVHVRLVPKQGLHVGVSSVLGLQEGADRTELAHFHPQDDSVDWRIGGELEPLQDLQQIVHGVWRLIPRSHLETILEVHVQGDYNGCEGMCTFLLYRKGVA